MARGAAHPRGALALLPLLPLLPLLLVLYQLCAVNGQNVTARSQMAFAQSASVLLSAYGFPDSGGVQQIDLYFNEYDLWTTVASPDSQSRWRCAAAVAGSDATMFVIAGGMTTGGPANDLIVVDVRGVVSPATALTAPLAQKKSISGGGGKFSDACAAPVWQQEVAFAGGLDDNSLPVADVRTYNPYTDRIRNVIATLSVARYSAACVSTGSVLWVAGGTEAAGGPSSVIDIFIVPSSDTAWAASSATLSVARTNIAATIAGGYAIFSGGATVSGFSSAIDLFKLSDLTITTISMPAARTVGALVTLPGSPPIAYALGGTNSSAVSGQVLQFPVQSPPAFLASPAIADFTPARWQFSAAAFGTNKIMVVGGQMSIDSASVSGVSNAVSVITVPTSTNPTTTTPATAPTSTPPPSATPLATTAPPPSPTAVQCVGGAPIAGAVCVAGVWRVGGSVVLTQELIVLSPVAIDGNGTISDVSVFDPAGVPIAVIGVATISGVLNIGLTQEPRNGQSITIIQAGAISGSFSSVTVDKQFADSKCRNVTAATQTTLTTLSVLMEVRPSGACKSGGGLSSGAIIGASVAGGAAVIVVIIVVVLWVGLAHNAPWAKRALRRRPLDRGGVYA